MTPKPGDGRVVVDLQAVQSVEQRHRGIPTYAANLTFAVEALDPGIVGTYALNPDLTVPEVAITERLLAAGKLRRSDNVNWRAAGLLHIASPMEMTIPAHRLMPPAVLAARLPWMVTLYDLIPQLMPEAHLEDPGLRRAYRARLQLVRTATAILTLSEASRHDVTEQLGLDPQRVFVIGAGTSERFAPPRSRTEAAAAAVSRIPGLRAPFVFYIGSYEKRKNLEPLLEAWAQLPEAVRSKWQLALCCPLRPLERNHLLHRSARLGIRDSVCLTGFIDDETLLLMHQGTDLFVFPSLYEGYGLPVAEALACGAPVLASNSSSLPEILGPEALFDASAPEPMAAAIERGLTDDGLRQHLLDSAGKAPMTWSEVAARTIAVYEHVLSGELPPPGRVGATRHAVGAAVTPPEADHRPSDRSRWPDITAGQGTSSATGQRDGPVGSAHRGAPVRRIAFVGALPPHGGAAGQWNARLLTALAARPGLSVSAFADRPAANGREALIKEAPAEVQPRPPGDHPRPVGRGYRQPMCVTTAQLQAEVPVRPLGSLEAVEGLCGVFDTVVYSLADDEDHTGTLATLRRRRDGVVVAHDVTLSNLYVHAVRSGALPDRLPATIQAVYGEAAHPRVGTRNRLPQPEAQRLGILFTRDVLAHCRRLLVMCPTAAGLADLDALPADRAKIQLSAGEPAAVADALYELVSAGGR